MNSHAPAVAASTGSSHSSGAFCRCRPPPWAAPTTPTPITSGTRNCTTATPMFPPAAFTPSAIPLRRSG